MAIFRGFHKPFWRQKLIGKAAWKAALHALLRLNESQTQEETPIKTCRKPYRSLLVCYLGLSHVRVGLMW